MAHDIVASYIVPLYLCALHSCQMDDIDTPCANRKSSGILNWNISRKATTPKIAMKCSEFVVFA